jgi:hypothetical protein
MKRLSSFVLVMAAFRRTNMKVKRFVILTLLTFATSAALGDGIVSSVVKAPITPDGDVASAPTDLVINLDTSLDPAFLGRALPPGCSVRVTLPAAFERILPVKDLFSAADCTPGNFQCTTGVFLQGWPQHPILPTFPPPGLATQYGLTLEGTHTLVFTALTDLIVPNPNPAPGPGLKQIHLISGFVNPKRPGFYNIQVEIGPEGVCTHESGVANVHIVPKIRPSVEVTSALNIGAPNTIYQQTTAYNDAPLPWDFLLWDRNGEPMSGVNVEMVNPDFALLKQGNRTVGHIRIQAPVGAVNHKVSGGPSTEINAPIKGIPTALLKVQFTAGSESGRYTTTVKLHGGNELNMFVDAQ